MQDFSELDAALLHIIDSEPQTEFDLIKRLQEAPWCVFKADCLAKDIELFQTHFVLFNALYRLRTEARQNLWFDIEIHTTGIRTVPTAIETAQDSVSLAEHDPLAAYYLDWDNFQSTRESDVQDLLNDFWHYYLSPDKNVSQAQRKQALRTLGFTEAPTSEQLKRTFRQMSFVHHPDKGGDNDVFLSIKRAYKILKEAQKNS